MSHHEWEVERCSGPSNNPKNPILLLQEINPFQMIDQTTAGNSSNPLLCNSSSIISHACPKKKASFVPTVACSSFTRLLRFALVKRAGLPPWVWDARWARTMLYAALKSKVGGAAGGNGCCCRALGVCWEEEGCRLGMRFALAGVDLGSASSSSSSSSKQAPVGWVAGRWGRF